MIDWKPVKNYCINMGTIYDIIIKKIWKHI